MGDAAELQSSISNLDWYRRIKSRPSLNRATFLQHHSIESLLAAVILPVMNNNTDGGDEGSDGDEDGVSTKYKSVVEGCWVVMFILILLGTVGNVLSIVTLCTKRLRPQATSASLQALAVADLIVLWTSLFRFNIYYLWMDDKTYIKTKFLYESYFNVYVEPFYWVGLAMSSFITLALTVQRYLAIRFPFGSRKYCTKSINIAVIVIVCLIPMAMTMPHFFYYEILNVKFPVEGEIIEVNVPILTDYGESDKYRCVYLTYLIPILWYVVPWLCLAILNTLLLVHVRRSAKVTQDSRGRSELSKRHSRNLTILMIVLVLTYMVLNLPKCVVVFIQLIREGSEELCTAGSQTVEEFPETTLQAADWVVSTLNNANSAVNFLLYCLFGERFRKEFERLFCRCNRKRRVAPATVTQGSMKSQTVTLPADEGQSVI